MHLLVGVADVGHDVADGVPAEALAEAARALAPERTAICGLFSGGTLCYESLRAVSRHLGPVHSNTPIRASWGLPAPEGAHVCLDLGEEEHTRGRPTRPGGPPRADRPSRG